MDAAQKTRIEIAMRFKSPMAKMIAMRHLLKAEEKKVKNTNSSACNSTKKGG